MQIEVKRKCKQFNFRFSSITKQSRDSEGASYAIIRGLEFDFTSPIYSNTYKYEKEKK